MCGRFTLRTPTSAIAEQFELSEAPTAAPRFNIAPTQAVAVVRIRPDERTQLRSTQAKERNEFRSMERELVWMQWGLVPRWAEDPSIGNRLINARAETAADKPAFRDAMRRRRCLIVADGFYEWQRQGGAKQPYFIRLRDGRPFAFAGLWEAWRRPDGSLLESCTLLTTDPNDLVRPIHDRMPVILPPDAYVSWLDPAERDARRLAPLLVPYPAEPMETYPVSTLVNSPSHESPECIEPAA
jgi:putative SOS response-associated peptidase YedK